MAGSQGHLVKYSIISGQLVPSGDPDDVQKLTTEYGAITSLEMDEKNEEGIIGTSSGYICYINFGEKVVIPIVSKSSPGMDAIDHVIYDTNNTQVFLANCGRQSGNVQLYTSATLDRICDFKEPDFGAVAFITYQPKTKRFRTIGHKEGYVKIIDVDTLGNNQFYHLDLHEGELLTTGTYSPCGKNIAIGTSFGNIFLCQMR